MILSQELSRLSVSQEELSQEVFYDKNFILQLANLLEMLSRSFFTTNNNSGYKISETTIRMINNFKNKPSILFKIKIEIEISILEKMTAKTLPKTSSELKNLYLKSFPK